jgi:Protein of unknown function (DUF3137)
VSDILAPEALSRIDAFYDATLKPKLDAIDDRRRQVRWLITKSLLIVLAPIGFLIAGDLLDTILPFNSSAGTVAIGFLWLVAALVFVLIKYLLPGITAYANYRGRFKQDIVAEIFKAVCPTASYDSLQGITEAVFDASGLFNTRGAFESDDRVRGRIGDTPFEASEVGRAYRTGTGKNSRSYVVFRGLFFHLDFRRRLNGVTLIDPERVQSHQIGHREGMTVVTLDHPAFEKEFTVHASDESEARALLTPAMMDQLLTLRRQAGKPVFLAFNDRRAYVGVHYDRTLFEPGVAQTTSKAAVREIAEHFALVETIVRELTVNARGSAVEADDSLLRGPGIEPHALSRLAVERAGTLTTSDLWAAANASIDDSAKDGVALAPRPEGTGIVLEQGPESLSITYGLRLGFWVMFAISLCGALLASSALRAPNAPPWASPASAWVRTLPPVPWLDAFAADAPMPWMIVGSVVAVLFALVWTGYVRRVSVDLDRIRIYRGLRPFPRVYRRPLYGRAIRIKTALYIAKSDGMHMMNPTASPVLTEPEAQWLVSEMKRTLRQM